MKNISPAPLSRSILPLAERAASVTRVRREVARAVDRDAVIGVGETVVVAVSGGPDSCTLLDVVARLAPTRGWRLLCVHVDHGLRAGSAADADVVASLADARAVPFEAVVATLPPRGSIQDRARRGRYAALSAVADRVAASAIVTGHTADDQAETVLWRVITGAPPASLAGMPARRGRLGRPLLGVWRADTEAYCEAIGITPLDDPANTDPRHLRTRIRHELLPLAEAIAPAARRRLVALAAEQRRLAFPSARDVK